LDEFVQELVGVDLAPKMIEHFQKKIDDKQLDSTRYSARCIDLIQNPLYETTDPTKYKQFDIIFSSLVLHHVPNAEKTLIELGQRHLATGGRLIIFDFLDDPSSRPQFQFHEHAQSKTNSDLGVHHGHGFTEEFLNTVFVKTLHFEFSIDKCVHNMKAQSKDGSEQLMWPIFCAVGKKVSA